LLTVGAWASAFPLIRIGLTGLDPLQLASARFALAAAIVLIWLMIFRPPLPSLRDAGLFLASGATGIAFYNALLNSGQQTVSAGAASFLINTSPIITALLAALFLRERYGLWGWIGSILALAGVGVIAAGQAGGLRLGAGASLVLAAAFCQASYFILQRPLVPRYGALTCTAYTILAGALLLSPWILGAAAKLAAAGSSHEALWAVAALAILPSAMGYAAWTYALDYYGASRAANFLYLVPPMTLVIAFGLTREVPAVTTLLGGALAIAGVAIVNLRRKLAPVVPSPTPGVSAA
jgi:drug/metabolite transporter (DMT)-like permease